MPLGDYLRWLATTMDEKHAPIVRERAKQADDLLAALKWLADSASASQKSPEAREWHTKDVWHGIELARAAIAKRKVVRKRR